MKTALVGYTGFVGSNIYAAGSFDGAYNSKNIEEAYGTNPDLLIYAGLRAEKYLANNAPEKDMELIKQAEDNITKINPKKLVLISTIDVFKTPVGVDENSEIDTEDLHAYGFNRTGVMGKRKISGCIDYPTSGTFWKEHKKELHL